MKLSKLLRVEKISGNVISEWCIHFFQRNKRFFISVIEMDEYSQKIIVECFNFGVYSILLWF